MTLMFFTVLPYLSILNEIAGTVCVCVCVLGVKFENADVLFREGGQNADSC